jgi:hypothetical protein
MLKKIKQNTSVDRATYQKLLAATEATLAKHGIYPSPIDELAALNAMRNTLDDLERLNAENTTLDDLESLADSFTMHSADLAAQLEAIALGDNELDRLIANLESL